MASFGLYSKECECYSDTDETSDKRFTRKMSDGFIEIIFLSSEFIERFRMESSFESDIDSIIDNDRREYNPHRENIIRDTIFDTDSRRYARYECGMC
jgi:hypothetical protein